MCAGPRYFTFPNKLRFPKSLLEDFCCCLLKQTPDCLFSAHDKDRTGGAGRGGAGRGGAGRGIHRKASLNRPNRGARTRPRTSAWKGEASQAPSPQFKHSVFNCVRGGGGSPQSAGAWPGAVVGGSRKAGIRFESVGERGGWGRQGGLHLRLE